MSYLFEAFFCGAAFGFLFANFNLWYFQKRRRDQANREFLEVLRQAERGSIENTRLNNVVFLHKKTQVH